jgi:hypothetical protein
MRMITLFAVMFLLLWVALCLGDTIVSDDTNIQSSQKVATNSACREVQK